MCAISSPMQDVAKSNFWKPKGSFFVFLFCYFSSVDSCLVHIPVVPGFQDQSSSKWRRKRVAPLFVFLAQHICVFFQWLSLACDFTCLFCKVPWAWVGGSLATPDQHRLRGQSLDCGPFCRRWVLASFTRLSNSLRCATIIRKVD